MATYFVTGATGFIGRHLVERLLAREGEIHVLVREGSEDKLAAVVSRLGGEGRIHAVRGDLSEPFLGVAPEAREALRGERRPLLPPRRDLRHDRGRDGERAAQRGRHAVRDRPGQRPRGRHVPPHLLDRRGRRVRGPLHRGHVRRGPAAAHGLPPHQVRVREARAPADQRRLARLPARDRGRRLAHGRDGQDRRALLLLQGDPEGAPRAARVVPAHRPRGRLDQPRPGRLRRRGDGPHRPPPGPRRPGVPPRLARAAGRRRAQHLRPRRATRRRWRSGSTSG